MAQHGASQWLDQNWRLIKNNHWVAAVNGSVIAQDPSLDLVLSAMTQSGIPLEQFAVAFFTADVIQ